MDKGTVFFMFLLWLCSTMSQNFVNLTGEESSINITSPNYPDTYDNNVDITWQVTAPAGLRIMVQFLVFDLEEPSLFKLGDLLTLHHGLTDSFDDATTRAYLSGSSLPHSISSIGSYLWLKFTTDGTERRKGFSLSVRAVKPDWACAFESDACGLQIDQGSWSLSEVYSKIEAVKTEATFIIPHAFTSKEGTLSFGRHQRFPASLTVIVCKSQVPSSYSTTFFITLDYEYIKYSCSSIQDIQVTFNATKTSDDAYVSVFDIQIYETSVPSTEGTNHTPLSSTTPGPEPTELATQYSASTISTNTTPLSSTTPGSEQTEVSTLSSVTAGNTTEDATSHQSTQTITIPSASTSPDISTHNPTNPSSLSPSEEYTSNSRTSPGTEGPSNLKTDEKCPTVMPTSTMTAIAEALGGSNSAVIPAVSSAIIVLIVVTIVIIALFVYRRRRSRDPKTAEPNDDDPNLYNNPVYCSKEDALPIPDLLVGTKFHASYSFQVPHEPPDMSNQYEEFAEGWNPAASDEGPEAYDTSCKDTPTDINTLESHAYYTLEDPSYQGVKCGAPEEEDCNTYEEAHGPQASKDPTKITKGQTGTDRVYHDLNKRTTSMNAYYSLAIPGGKSSKREQSGGIPGSSNGTAVLADEEEYSGLTFSKSSDIKRVLKNPMAGDVNVSDGYGVLDLPGDQGSSLSPNTRRLHNDDVYNSLNEPPHEQQNNEQKATDTPSGYQALKFGKFNNPTDRVLRPQGHKGDSTPNDGSNGGYKSFPPVRQGSVEQASTCKDTTSNINTLDSHAYYTLEDPSYQGETCEAPDEQDYHTYEQANGPQASDDSNEITKGRTGTDNLYQDLNKLTLSINAYSSLGISGGESSEREQSCGIPGPQNGTAVLDDDEEYNRLTFNQPSDITRAINKPRANGENFNDGYGVLDLPEDQASSLSPNSLQLHNDNVYNSLNEPPLEQLNDEERATQPHAPSGYQALKLGQTKNPPKSVVSPQGDVHTGDAKGNGGSNGGYLSLSLGQQGPRPNANTDEVDRQDAESEYHNDQDPSQMNQQGSYPTTRVSNDQYNILDSGKRVGDYHVHQETDDATVDEGDYEDLDPKMSSEEEYSTIDQNQNHTTEATGQAGFEPIYSNEVYSEFQ